MGRRPDTLLVLLVALAAVFALGLLLAGPFGDPRSYHDFADRRTWLGIPNAGDVLSNALFCAAGALGLVRARRLRGARWRRATTIVLFAALILTGIGSAYYHWSPSAARLFWDRLPLTFVITALLALVVGDRIDPRAGAWTALPLALLGTASVCWWQRTVRAGAPDVRLYAFVQYYSLAALPLVLVLRPAGAIRTRDLAWVLALYAAAKVCELLDRQVFALLGVVSGHTLKHVLAGCGALVLVRALCTARAS
jgi:hypothetical protein